MRMIYVYVLHNAVSIPASKGIELPHDLPYQCYGVEQIRPGYWVPADEWPALH